MREQMFYSMLTDVSIEIWVWNMHSEMIIHLADFKILRLWNVSVTSFFLKGKKPTENSWTAPAPNTPGSDSRIMSNFGVSPAASAGQELTYIWRGVWYLIFNPE